MLRGRRTEERKLGRNDKKRIEWLKALEWASSSIAKAGVEHAFVKLLTDPPIFSDIDIMVPKVRERKKALEASL